MIASQNFFTIKTFTTITPSHSGNDVTPCTQAFSIRGTPKTKLKHLLKSGIRQNTFFSSNNILKTSILLFKNSSKMGVWCTLIEMLSCDAAKIP